MTYFPETKISLADSASIDAFGRLRISNSISLFDSKLLRDKQTLFWDESLTGSATSTYNTNQSSVTLACTTGATDVAIRQTKEYFNYQPGKSHLIFITGLIGSGQTNTIKRIGYFDASNGIFFELNGTTLNVVRRTFTSGSVVDNSTAQSNWNIDKLDGSGISGITLDITKVQIFVIDMQWLGIGRIRIGVQISGIIYYCHQFLTANLGTLISISTPNLPIRYEIRNIAGTVTSSSLICICSMIASEAGYEPQGLIGSVGMIAQRTAADSVRTPMIAIRLKSTNIRQTLVPKSISINCGNNSIYWELIINPTLTSPTWNSVHSNSAVEYDVVGTSGAGGYVLESGYVSLQSRMDTVILKSTLNMVANISGTADILLLAATSLNATSQSFCSITWEEFG